MKAQDEAKATAKAEEDKRLAVAQALEQAGQADLAAQVVAQDAPVVAPLPKAAPLAQNSTLRDNWKAKVTNRDALMRAILDGKVVEPPNEPIVVIDMTVLNRWAKAMKDSMAVPGVEATNDKILQQKGR